jgi:hypothetical protein
VTLAQAIAALQGRLYLGSDANQQFWTSTELQAYIVEALKTWNALTGFWRGQMSFTLVKNQWFYDLTAQSGTLRPFTTTDNLIETLIEYHLLEPLVTSYPLSWMGSNQFSIADILYALERTHNAVLGSALCTLARSTLSYASGRVTLPDTTLVIRRVCWLPQVSGFSVKPLEQSDDFTLESFDANWTTAPAGVPSAWLQSADPPLGIRVDRTSPCSALLEILSANSDGALSTSSAKTLSIPDDWAWVDKWGALADLFGRESLAKDPLREKYCRQRYEEGIALLSEAPSVVSATLNGSPIGVDSIRNGDDFEAGWQASPAGPPDTIYMAGLNLAAFSPAPNSSTAYTAVLSVVQNQPVPSGSGDYLQIPRDQYDALIGYAHHLAVLKLGGAEFLATVPMYSAFLRAASLYNSQLSERGYFAQQMQELSQLQSKREPVYSTTKPEAST